MAAKPSFLEEELCCSVCCELFTEPVVLKCSHSFCKVCLQRCWEEKDSRECPLCRRVSFLEPVANLVLKNVVASYLERKADTKGEDTGGETEPVVKSEECCGLHGEKLLFYCAHDEEAICVVCQTSRKHLQHHVCPVEEAALDLKEELENALKPVKEKLERFTHVKQESEKSFSHIRSQAQHTEKLVKAEFEKLHQFLREEEKARLAALKEEEKQKSKKLMEKIQDVSRQIANLSDKIANMEKALKTDNISFLKSYKDNKKRAQCTLQDPVLLSGALINVAKHLGNLKFSVWEKMLEMVQYTPVTLDPNTASPWLCVSDDLTAIKYNRIKQQLPNNPERFNPSGIVLGSEGFTSGKHSWEVEVGSESHWDVGVVKESISRKGKITCNQMQGYWAVMLRNGSEYYASTLPGTQLTLKNKPQRIRVQLDYDKGEVSFCDPSNMHPIYTFRFKFTERLLPYLHNSNALRICPALIFIKSD